MPFATQKSFVATFIICVAALIAIAAMSTTASTREPVRAQLQVRSTQPCSIGCEWGPTVAASLQQKQDVRDAVFAAIVEQQRLAAEQAAAEEEAAAEAAKRASRSSSTRSTTSSTMSSTMSSTEGGTACAIPAYICDRESGGDLTVYNHQGSGASGKYQFMPRTWNGYGGYANAADAPEAVQDAKATELWAGGAGCGHWSAC